MEKEDLSKIRVSLGKTQRRMAQVLGISLKAVQSFEQGWRKVPAHIERQALFLLATKKWPHKKPQPCWKSQKCSMERKRNCPAWEFRAGHLCWFINGTICNGEIQDSWRKKMKICRECVVFKSMFPAAKTRAPEAHPSGVTVSSAGLRRSNPTREVATMMRKG